MTTRHDNTLPHEPQAASIPGEPWHMQVDDWNRRYASDDFIWSEHPNRSLEQHVQPLPAGRALDLAAGECRNAVWLASQGWSVEAVDFARLALEKGRRLAQSRQVAERIRLVTADLNDYIPAERVFDLVTLVYLQLPWPELVPILLRAAGAVAPGGTLLLIAHHTHNLMHGHGGPRLAEVLYTAEQVATLLAPELRIERAERLRRPVHTADGIRHAIDCLVRATRD
ncbi:class I SAM-dependent methyltransferase [Vogesella indigofera]|uniref:class I SAM-dependent methyltransferase n=1 Tax=Vogesella indigofera TaxID=45465 RepID=UPI00234E6704|nr:class I SAM-dependent methyltransferase [Vogesella indigofera]MDC7710354.1 class I SAM-dependent methyltransferase [Vogesella indigofera]